jgi:hypothetical protein
VSKGRVISTFGGLAIAAGLLGASTASAATLVGDYQLQGTRASTVPGPALTDIAGGNAFQAENVMGTSRQVLSFPLHSGVQMTPSVGTGDVPYSVVSTFRLDRIATNPDSSYVRLLDPSNGIEDLGFYSYDGKADYYGNDSDVFSANVDFSDNAYVTVAMTSLPPALSRVYVNGALAVSAPDIQPVASDTLRLFKDDNDSEESGGAVSCVRVYTGALTDDEVAGIGASPTCGTVTPLTQPVTKKKKCKKHKKKHRAADAKKKKCKKRKKH